jgi:glycosyltransferase involved in cell wall biosynthesis
MVLVEAMICGVPVISTNCPVGPKEILQDGKNGLLVPVGDSKKMGKAILKVMNDINLKKYYIENARKRVEDFSMEKTIKDVERLFDELDGE